MATITHPLVPKKWDVLRSFIKYPNNSFSYPPSHPGLVLHVIVSDNLKPIVVIAGGTGTFDKNTGNSRKMYYGQIKLSLDLCQTAGLKKETKFGFSEKGIYAFYWDNEFFSWDQSNPSKKEHPLYGSLNTNINSFKTFENKLKKSKSGKILTNVIKQKINDLKNY